MNKLGKDIWNAENDGPKINITLDFLKDVKEILKNEGSDDPEVSHIIEDFVYEQTIREIASNSSKYTKLEIVELMKLCVEILDLDLTKWHA